MEYENGRSFSTVSLEEGKVPTTAVTTLFCLQRAARGVPQDLRGRDVRMCRAFRESLPYLNLVSTCYLVGSRDGDAARFFLDCVEEAGDFLAQHGFLQVSMRPVHAFSHPETETWMALYERFLLCLKPFQQEGYREQIVARFRIFPVLFFPHADAVESCRPFLRYLKGNFFLPSLLLPMTEARAAAKGLCSGSDPDWERMYFTRAEFLAAEPIVETLRSHAVCDRVLDRSGTDFSEERPLCGEIRVLEDAGLRPVCGETGNRHDRRSGRVPCVPCVPNILGEVEESFRQDGREGSWRQVAERLAGVLQEKGHKAEAVPVWDRCFRGRPPGDIPLHQRLQKALCRYDSGDLEGAMTDLAEACRLHPDSPEVRFYMGRCEFGWRDYIEAADRFSEALERGLANPMKQEAEYLRGESHVHLEEYEEALRALRKAEEEGRADSPLYFYQGLCLLGTGDPSGAVALLQKAWTAGPSQGDRFHVLFYTAHALKESGSFCEALPYCERAEALDANHQELFNLKGFCHFKLGQHEAAIRCFRRCIEIDPRSAIDYANIGSNLREMGDLEGAAAVYRQALAMDPDIGFARESLQRIEKTLKSGSAA